MTCLAKLPEVVSMQILFETLSFHLPSLPSPLRHEPWSAAPEARGPQLGGKGVGVAGTPSSPDLKKKGFRVWGLAWVYRV